jgi:hypothetical protein
VTEFRCRIDLKGRQLSTANRQPNSHCEFKYPISSEGIGFALFYSIQITNKMGNLLYIIAVILIIGWAIGFFGYAAGGIIHILLVIAIVLILLRVIRREA